MRIANSNKAPYVQKTPQEIARFYWQYLKTVVDSECLSALIRCVVAVSPSLSIKEVTSIKRLLSSAGYRFIHCMPTPIAVAMVYQFYQKELEKLQKTQSKNDQTNQKQSFETFNYLVLNWGASVAEVSLVKSQGKRFGSKLELVGFESIQNCGGHDITEKLTQHCISEFVHSLGEFVKGSTPSLEAIMENKAMLARLRRECELVKVSLSLYNQTASVRVIDFFQGKTLNVPVSFTLVQNFATPVVIQFGATITTLLAKHHIQPNDVDEILFAGGSTRFPQLRENISTMFLSAPIHDEIDPTEIAAMGAALKASYFANFYKLQRIYINLRRLLQKETLHPKEMHALLQNDPVGIELIYNALEKVKGTEMTERMDEFTVNLSVSEYSKENVKSLQDLFESVDSEIEKLIPPKKSKRRPSRDRVENFTDLFSALETAQVSVLESPDLMPLPLSTTSVSPTTATPDFTSVYWWNAENPDQMTTDESVRLEKKLWDMEEQVSQFAGAGGMALLDALALEEAHLERVDFTIRQPGKAVVNKVKVEVEATTLAAPTSVHIPVADVVAVSATSSAAQAQIDILQRVASLNMTAGDVYGSCCYKN